MEAIENNWIIKKVQIIYPSIKEEFTNDDYKYYAIDFISYTYKNYELHLYYENNYLDFSVLNKNSKKFIIEDLRNYKIDKALDELNLPSINNLINENEEIEFFIMENDADTNYDSETNIKLIKSGDYGFCLDYNSVYSISDLDFENNEKIKE